MNGWLERALFFMLGVLLTGAFNYFALYSDKQVLQLRTERNESAHMKNAADIDKLEERMNAVESNQRRVMDRLEMDRTSR